MTNPALDRIPALDLTPASNLEEAMNRTLLTTLTFVLACSLLGGCVPVEEAEDAANDAQYRQAVPTGKPMEITVPNDDASGNLALGERAGLYTITRTVSVAINARVAYVLGTLKLISLLPPSERGDNYRVWGPTKPEGLEPLSWRMRVEKQSETQFTFVVDARSKASTAEEDFHPIISGTVTPGANELKSVGSMMLNFDNFQTVGGADPCPHGIIHVRWDASQATRTVEVEWENFEDTCNNERIENATYRYAENDDASGDFEFSTEANIHAAAENKPEKETATMKSRWMADGAGRSDVYLSGTEIAADLATAGLVDTQVQATQCWDNLFALTHADTAPTELEPLVFPELGAVTDCAFQDADFPQL